MNVNGRLGADAIQRMQQAQQANAPQVESQNEETSQTVRKPLSKAEVAAMMKGKVGKLTNNVNTGNITTQEAQAASAAEYNTDNPDVYYASFTCPPGTDYFKYLEDLKNMGVSFQQGDQLWISYGGTWFVYEYDQTGYDSGYWVDDEGNALQ